VFEPAITEPLRLQSAEGRQPSACARAAHYPGDHHLRLSMADEDKAGLRFAGTHTVTLVGMTDSELFQVP
jgi:hypothetical protein